MPRPHTIMRKIRDVLRLRLGEHLSLRQVALSLAIPHTTVADYVRRARDAGITSWPLSAELIDDDALEARLFGPPASSPSLRPEPDFEMMKRELARKGMTLMLLWVEYREEHHDGYEYSQFCLLYRTWRKKLDVTMRQDHKAGEKMFVDFPGLTIPIYDERDCTVSFHAELFVSVLGASSYLYAEALRSQELVHWCHAHENAFEFYGGCPALAIPDNLRSGVSKSNRYEPDLNATYQEMAQHYGVVIIPARPYKPRDKAKVESGVQLVERWIIMRLRKERFTSLAALNERIAELVEIINRRPFKKMEGSRASVFAEIDLPALRPLPNSRYDFATWTKAKAEAGVQMAERWIIMRLRKERHVARGAERSHRRVGGDHQPATLQEVGRLARQRLRRDRPTGATPAARHALRLRRLDQSQGEPRLPPADRSQFLQRPLRPGGQHPRRAHQRERGGGVLKEPSRRQPQTQLRQGRCGH